jgi:hypothetical protein
MADLFTALEPFMAGIMSIINTLLVPTDGTGVTDWAAITPIQTLAWFGLIMLFVPVVFGLIMMIVRAGRGAR